KDTDTTIQLPDNLPDGTTLQVKSVNDLSHPVLDKAGEVYDFVFTYPKGHESYSGDFTLTLGVRDDAQHPAIYHYNEQTKTWKQVGGKRTNGTITATVSHFSPYGVF